MRLLKNWQEHYRSLNPRFNRPTKLTILRIGLSPIFFILLMLETLTSCILALLFFFLAAISDAYDGYLARKNGQVTKFGKIIDPIADKLLMSIAFIGFWLLGYVPLWVVLLILIREYAITLLRTIGIVKGVIIAADRWGKYKTISQMAFTIAQIAYMIFIMLLQELNIALPDIWQQVLTALLTVMLYLALILTVGSGINYVIQNKRLIKELLRNES